MFDDIQSYALGSHAWFYREGEAYTLLAPGTVGVEALPDPTDPGWALRNIGDIEEWADKKNEDTEEILKPSPGVLKRKDIITFFQSLDIELTTNSLRRIAMQIMYGSDTTLDDTHGQFVPLSAVPPRGWLTLQRYTQNDDLVFAANLWVRLDITDTGSGNKKIVKPKFMAKLLDSDLNTMFFGDPSLLG
jgi:hypothetical protein